MDNLLLIRINLAGIERPVGFGVAQPEHIRTVPLSTHAFAVRIKENDRALSLKTIVIEKNKFNIIGIYPSETSSGYMLFYLRIA
jgi:hypothetical protein